MQSAVLIIGATALAAVAFFVGGVYSLRHLDDILDELNPDLSDEAIMDAMESWG